MTIKELSTLGADIEFMFFTQKNEMVPAMDIIGKKDVHSLFGVDGADRIAEIRVAPAYDPRNLYINTYKSLLEGWTKFPKTKKYIWKAIGDNYRHTVSTHFHCVMPVEANFVKMCDNTLLPIFLLIDNVDHIEQRHANGYLKLSSTRKDVDDTQKANPHKGFEYRPCGPSLHSKIAVYAGYIIWAALVDAYYLHNIKYEGSFCVTNDMLRGAKVEIIRKNLDTIFSFVLSLPYFSADHFGARYYRDVYNFYRLIRDKKIPDPANVDIRKVWKLEQKNVLENKESKVDIDEILNIQLI